MSTIKFKETYAKNRRMAAARYCLSAVWICTQGKLVTPHSPTAPRRKSQRFGQTSSILSNREQTNKTIPCHDVAESQDGLAAQRRIEKVAEFQSRKTSRKNEKILKKKNENKDEFQKCCSYWILRIGRPTNSIVGVKMSDGSIPDLRRIARFPRGSVENCEFCTSCKSAVLKPKG